MRLVVPLQMFLLYNFNPLQHGNGSLGRVGVEGRYMEVAEIGVIGVGDLIRAPCQLR